MKSIIFKLLFAFAIVSASLFMAVGQMPTRLPVSPVTENIVFNKNVTVLGTITANITILGTITTGVWQGTAIADTYIATSANWNTAYSHSLLVAGNPHVVTKSDVGLGSVENTALSTWAGTANITTIGAATGTSLGLTGGLSTNTALASGNIGLNLYSITPTFATIAQSNAEGIASSSDTRIGLDETLRNLIICDRGDIATDFGLIAEVNPTLIIFDEDLSDYTKFYQANNQFVFDSRTAGASQRFYSKKGWGLTLYDDVDTGNIFAINSDANMELTDSDGQQSWMYLEPKSKMTATGAFNASHINLFAGNTYGDGSTGDGNNFIRWADDGTTIYKFNLTGAYHFKETTTPTAVTNYGALYTKTDDILYFQDGSGNEHAIKRADAYYAEMYLNANGNPSTIETASIPIALREFTTGSLQNFTFDAGSTAAITVYADYSGTVAGTVLATSTHGLTTGDIISIRGTTNYNGIFQVTVVDDTHFYFTDGWVADDGASDFDEPSHLVAGTTAVGVYTVSWDMSSSEGGAAGSTFTFVVYNNVTAHAKSRVQRKFANNDVGAFGGRGVMTIAAGDWVFLTTSSGGTNDITNSYGAMILTRL